MILFVADDHFGTHPGQHEFDLLKGDFPEMQFVENDWSAFTKVDLVRDCDLLVLNMIASTCNQPLPDEAACAAVKAYCEAGKPLLLIHGASSAFWHCDWWRRNSGFRWVRPGDPDNVEPSVHSKEPFLVTVSKSRHPLAKKLVPMNFTEVDEIYTNLEQTSPMWVLMSTNISTGSFPQVVETINEWGGTVINILPGHFEAATTNPDFIANLKTLITYLR